MANQVTEIVSASRVAGLRIGWLEGFLAAKSGATREDEPFQDVDTESAVLEQLEKFDEMEFPVMKTVEKCLSDPDPIGRFRYFIEETDHRGRERAEKEAAEKAAAGAAKEAGEGASGTEHELPSSYL